MNGPAWLRPLLIAVLCLIWGSTWLGIRLGPQELPLTAAGARFALAGLVMIVITPTLRRLEGAPPPPTWLWVTAAVTNFAGSYGILYVAETVVPSGVAAVLWAIFPVLMAIAGTVWLGETLSRRQTGGLLLSFSGIVAMFSGDLGVGPEALPMALLLLGSPIVSAVGTVLIKKHGSKTSSIVLNRNGMVLGAVLLGGAALLREGWRPEVWTTQGVVSMAALALVGTVFAFSTYFWLLRHMPAGKLSLISYVTPVLATLLGVAVGDGKLDGATIVGTGLVIAGVCLVVRKPKG
ncbi:MAG: EamA family transporter [Planctomycetes bacterium]|nr:EamA family transporter [Planctomycetota bacterium]